MINELSGSQIRDWREGEKLSRRELSVKMNLAENTILRWEHDRCKPGLANLRKLRRLMCRREG